jgi:multiple sugar transport system substrate-binding protein
VRALQFIKDLKWKYGVIQSDILIDNEQMFKLFATDQVAMAMMTPEWIPLLVEKYHMKLEEIGVTILPAGPAGHVNQTGGNYCIINPMISKEKQDAAWMNITFNYDTELFEEMTKLRVKQKRIVGFPQLASFKGERKAVYDRILDKYRNVPRYERFSNDASNYAKPEPPFFCQQLYSEGLTPAVQSVLTNPNADPQKVLNDGVKLFQSRFLDKVNKK